MSEPIREQISAFLDGELPDSETELLFKRLIRDGELRESFGRYALIGEALRGAGPSLGQRGFAERVNRAIDGEPVAASAHDRAGMRAAAVVATGDRRGMAAGVAAVAVVALAATGRCARRCGTSAPRGARNPQTRERRPWR